MTHKQNRYNVTQEIFDTLFEANDLLFEWMENPHKQRRRLRGWIEQDEWNQLFSDQKKKRALRRLKKQAWLSHRQEGNRMVYEIHENAVVQFLKNTIRSSTFLLPTPMIVLVTFDFPEAARKARNSFRHYLKQVGFSQQQLSVWATKKSVAREIRLLIRMLKIEKWVNVYLAQET
jgi:DNA-binding transcriptional regulator PaaX